MSVVQDPARTLVAPTADPLLPPALDAYLHIGDLISLGHWALVAIDKMGGPNIAQEIGEWFAGDWEEVTRSASALEHLGEFCDATSEGVRSELEHALAGWDGKAADAASSYFGDLADALATQAGNFRDIARQYTGTAFGVKELASAVGSLVESLVDYAIAAGISLAAAAASSWTIVGGLAGGAAAGYSIVRGAQTIKLILEIRAKVWTACEALMGLIVGPLAAIDGFTSIELPGSYDHPSVA